MAAAMTAVSAMSMTSAFASEIDPITGDRTTEVTYDSRGIATEGDPDTAQWGVAVPSKVSFTDDSREADVSVQLVGYNGYTMKDLSIQELKGGETDFKATVNVKSANSLKLVTADDSESVKYKLNYGTTAADDITSETADIVTGVKLTDLGIDKSTPDNFVGKSQKGTATLLQIGNEQATHTDTLTFMVSSNLKTPNPDKIK